MNHTKEETGMSEFKFSVEIASIFGAFLKTDDWHYRFDKEEGLFRFSLNLKSKLNSIEYHAQVEEDAFCVYAIAPINADVKNPEERAAMAEFICRANHEMRYGNFEFDLRDGEIRYKFFVDCNKTLPSPGVVKDSIYVPAIVFECYAPGILAILFNGANAEEAIDLCERDA